MEKSIDEKPSLSDLEHAGLSAALQAGDVLREGFYSELEIKQKSHIHDLVTQFDVKAEETIVRAIRSSFPTHAFLGEESGLQGDPKNNITWIIDPIDGTWNFARQIPSFSTSIAAVKDGKPIVAICYNPLVNELFIAKKGEGASMNGKKLQVSDISDLKACGISLGGHVGLTAIHQISQIRRSGSSVLDLCYIAKGAIEGFIELRLNVWDYAAAGLVIEEAGGTITTSNGGPVDYSVGQKSSIVASNGKIHEELINWISTAEK